MPRGRKPKPAALKRLAGNPGRRRLAPEPVIGRGAPTKPKELTGAAAEEWERVTRLLSGAGLLMEADRAALAIYCQAWARWLEAEKHLRKDGAVIESPSGYPIQSPWVSIAASAVKQMHHAITEFGLSPVSRARLSVPEVQSDPIDKQYFGE